MSAAGAEVATWDGMTQPVFAPPPPGVRAEGVTLPAVSPSLAMPRGKVKAQPFDAEMDVGEMDEKSRPGPAWTCRGREVSRERLVFMSRRMLRYGALVIVAVHMLDDEPMPLFGRVVDCLYEADGLHKVTVEFRPVPWNSELRGWMAERARAR